MLVRRLFVALMIASLPTGIALADNAAVTNGVDSAADRRVVPKNVELDAGGNLNFAFVDTTGRSVPEATAIVVADQHPKKFQATSSGKFIVPVQKSGLIIVTDGEYTYGCRVWKHGTAPPKSLSSIAFVKKQDAVAQVRGQGFGSALRSTEKLYGVAILALGGYALWQALDRDDDAS